VVNDDRSGAKSRRTAAKERQRIERLRRALRRNLNLRKARTRATPAAPTTTASTPDES
jgi:hypothetical protein